MRRLTTIELDRKIDKILSQFPHFYDSNILAILENFDNTKIEPMNYPECFVYDSGEEIQVIFPKDEYIDEFIRAFDRRVNSRLKTTKKANYFLKKEKEISAIDFYYLNVWDFNTYTKPKKFKRFTVYYYLGKLTGHYEKLCIKEYTEYLELENISEKLSRRIKNRIKVLKQILKLKLALLKLIKEYNLFNY